MFALQSINELNNRLNGIGKDRRDFSIPKDYTIKPEFSRNEKERSFKDFSVPPSSSNLDSDDLNYGARSRSSTSFSNSNNYDKSSDRTRGSSIDSELNDRNSKKPAIDKIREESEEEGRAEEERKILLNKSREQAERLAREQAEKEKAELERLEREKQGIYYHLFVRFY